MSQKLLRLVVNFFLFSRYFAKTWCPYNILRRCIVNILKNSQT